MNKKILFVSHKKAQCGVYEFGKNITDVLQNSKRYQFIRVECSSFVELQTAITEHSPAAIIYNYHPSVMPWLATHAGAGVHRNNIAYIPIPQVGIIHEITQHVADTAINYKKKFLLGGRSRFINSLFDFYITADPTLALKNPIVYKTGRLIPRYRNNFPISSKPIIGSFGFGTPKKGFERIVQLVQQEFDEAVIRFNIPAADFGDKGGVNARVIAEKCKAFIFKSGIQLIVTHDFLDHSAMLDFLAKNTLNVFLYENKNNRGLSSAIDNAMAVQRPIAVSDGVMFRHVLDVKPSVCIAKNNLKTIIQNGFAPLQKHYDEWNAENLLWEYERMLSSVFAKLQEPSKPKRRIIRVMRSRWRRLLSRPDIDFTWIRN